MKNPNAIWFQRKGDLFAQVMRIGDGAGNNRYRFEVYREHVYPRWYPYTKTGVLLHTGDAPTLPRAKNAVFKSQTWRTE